MFPANHAGPVDQVVSPVRVKATFIEDSVSTRDVPFEVAKQICLHLQLVLEFAQRRNRIDRNWENLHALSRKLIEILGKAHKLLRAGACKGKRKKSKQHVPLAAKGAERDVGTRGGGRGKIGSDVSDLRRILQLHGRHRVSGEARGLNGD